MWHDHMWWGWGGVVMMILWIVLLAAIIYWIIRAVQRNNTPYAGQESAMDILKKRYARGEISKQEFEERKRDLSE
ncbi:SHOCT domain-containing protein [Chitinispirillales bacterium ANBcel5]|uniref:SHOCT domain-containing protein n=1 Tax=Cellulosispirillum alkaliphilum TaxID=3039283 RepID=UPI002A54F4AB|nr:SHOCT domain-containing protein [Chitinispirillales bacterium ANBcel5]